MVPLTGEAGSQAASARSTAANVEIVAASISARRPSFGLASFISTPTQSTIPFGVSPTAIDPLRSGVPSK
jgi:hypothetical protein